ncbi:hypothetical protein JCM33374_g2228 [Metschnikowia sp. JCM 33374]|nr:hypothetical protein JCM33374_g2228 [Metschnikowia sp. JCM 33374]
MRLPLALIILLSSISAQIPPFGATQDPQQRPLKAKRLLLANPIDDTTVFTKTEILDGHLEWLVENLKSYIYPSYFDAAAFKNDQSVLFQDLTTIHGLMSELGRYHPDIFDQQQFARYMFETMVLAAHKMNQVHFTGGKECTLITYMIELNVRCLSMYTSRGMADSSMEGYAKTVVGFWREFCSWKRDFSRLEKVAFPLLMFFEREQAYAEGSIKALWGALSDESRLLCPERSEGGL